jgi:phage terminase small subunit
MADKLTVKQEKYVQGLFAGLSQREAYKQAYNCENMTDKSIDEKACELAKNVKVASRLKELTDELKNRNMVTVERVLAELARVAYANGTDFARVVEKEYIEDVKDEEGNVTGQKVHKYKTVEVIETNKLSEDKRAAIAGIKATEKGIEVKMADKIKALELMGKYLGMFTDKVEAKTVNTNIDIDYSALPPEALEEIAKAQGQEEVMRIVSKYRK